MNTTHNTQHTTHNTQHTTHKNAFIKLVLFKGFLFFNLMILSKTIFSQGWVGNTSTLYSVNNSLQLTPLNVGIGTNSPSAQLHTTGTIRHDNLSLSNAQTRVLVTDASGNLFYRDASTIGSQGAWLLNGNAGTNPTTNFIGTTDNVNLTIRTNNLPRMTVLSGGNVGVGLVAPKVQFHVTDAAGSGALPFPYETAVVERNGDLKLGVYSSSATAAGGAAIALGYSNFVDANGLYPGFEMQFGYANAQSFLRFNSLFRNANGTVSATSSANQIVMDNNSRLGIGLGPANSGTPNLPTANLDVNGTVRFRNLPTSGGSYLVVDVNGNVRKSANSALNRPIVNIDYSQQIKELKSEINILKEKLNLIMQEVNFQKNLSNNTVQNENKIVLIYPNPARDVLKIQLVENKTTSFSKHVTLIDFTGKEISSYSMNQSLTISTRTLIPGTYTINIYDKNMLLQSEKVVIIN